MVHFNYKLGGLIFGLVSGAVLLIPFSASAGEGCADVPEDIQYSATFKLQESAPEARKLRLTVGRNKSSPAQIAQIWSGDSCLAMCKTQNLDSDQSMDMECHGIQLASLSTHVTLNLKSKPTLRFGTWLKGYEDAFLLVELDRFSIGMEGSKIARK